MSTPCPLRVFLADDHPVVLLGVKALISTDNQIELVGEAADGPTALRRAIELRPDVAILDLSPGLNGIEVSRGLLAQCPHCRVVIFTVSEDATYLRQLLDLGIAGYVLKRSATDELSRSIHAVAAGGIYLDPAVAAIAFGSVSGRATGPGGTLVQTDPETHTDLSARETDVLRLTAAGHSTKAIAAKLEIGVKSVDTYKTRAMAKLGIRSRVDVVRYALSKGWMQEG
jgi:DNA-binding NarL/FixJ family response regulator